MNPITARAKLYEEMMEDYIDLAIRNSSLNTSFSEIRALAQYYARPKQCTCGMNQGLCVRGTGDCMSGRLIEVK